jgi:hypothetical protein
MTEYSGFLFARPSFLEGVSRVVDFWGTLNEYNTSLDGTQADSLALAADIDALQGDLAVAAERLQAEVEPAA